MGKTRKRVISAAAKLLLTLKLLGCCSGSQPNSFCTNIKTDISHSFYKCAPKRKRVWARLKMANSRPSVFGGKENEF
uniref:Putative secreted protein n=1 Tax=Ixodes scapularis TaxID=6945 RepID=A0A4D5RCR0_IXOSC